MRDSILTGLQDDPGMEPRPRERRKALKSSNSHFQEQIIIWAIQRNNMPIGEVKNEIPLVFCGYFYYFSGYQNNSINK